MDIHSPSPGALTTRVRLSTVWWCGALVLALSVWVLKSFLLAILVACVTAIASWTIYRRFSARMPSRLSRSVTPLIFTALMTIFVLAPLTLAFAALGSEAHSLLLAISAADEQGIPPPQWLDKLPLASAWLADRWRSELAHPGALLVLAQRADTAALLGWAHSLGRFMVREVFIITFTILVLFFVYQHGESLAQQFRRLVRHGLGEEVEATLDVATRALRASASSMLVVGLFDGVASGAAYAVAGVPHPATWGAITGALALVPFLGYGAVLVLTLQLVMTEAAGSALVVCALGSAVLFGGDKIVRPAVAREGTRLSFVWVLMSCLGGFEALGLVGLVVGPVVLTLVREFWEQRLRALVPKTNALEV